MNWFKKLKWYLKKYFTKIPAGGVADIPDERDLLMGSPVSRRKMPKYVNMLEEAFELGYKSSLQIPSACTAWELIGAAEIMNTIEDQKPVHLNELEQWNKQKLTGASEKGDSLQNALKTFIQNPQGRPLTEYRRLREKRLDWMKKWLALRIPIYTGVKWKISAENESGYSITKQTGTYDWFMGKTIGAHATVIVGYDDNKEHFICYDRLRPQWGKNLPHMFYIPYKHAHRTMTQYILRDARDS